MDTIDIVELLSPPRRRPSMAEIQRWTNAVNEHLADLRDAAERRRGQVTVFYDSEPVRCAYFRLGVVGDTPVSLVVKGEGRLGVELFLQVASDKPDKLRELPILSRQTKRLANDLLNVAELQDEQRQQKLG